MRIAASMTMIAITTTTSIRVKARSTGGGELLAMDMGLGAHHIAHGGRAKAKKNRQSKIA